MNAPPIGSQRVAKRLNPGQAGTLKLARRFGDKLVCVRHRIDDDAGCRHTTVELVVETTPLGSRATDVLVRLRSSPTEKALHTRLKQHGARWNSTERLWVVPRRTAIGMGLGGRIVGLVKKPNKREGLREPEKWVQVDG